MRFIVKVMIIISCVFFVGSLKGSVQVGIPIWVISTAVICRQSHPNITPALDWHLNYYDDYPPLKPSSLGLPVDCIWPLVKKYVSIIIL